MPHIVIEYSENLTTSVETSQITKVLHQVVTDSGYFSPQAVKARSVSYEDVILPEGAINFLHITVSILTGRTLEERQSLSSAVFEAAQKILPEVDKLSCNIHEMDKEVYRK